MTGTLYLVATPIGNLKDITLRAIETLQNVDIIACEDTRHTRRLLDHYQIRKELVSYHEHNELERTAELILSLRSGRSVAVVSDAGTPGISDPSYRIVVEAVRAGIQILPIPGPVAFVSAAIISGLPTDSVYFGGFLPSRKGDRIRRLDEVRNIPATLAFYEAPHRIMQSLADCISVLGDRQAAVIKELTKIHEVAVRGLLSEIIDHFSRNKPRGEFVITIDRTQQTESDDAAVKSLAERLDELIDGGLDRKGALKVAAKEFGLSKSEAYRRLELEKNR